MPDKQTQELSFGTRLFNLLVSMKFAIIILIVLGATSLLSMLINEYPNFFHEGTFLHTIFQQHSPYSSWWYTILLWFLVISVLMCVIQNLPITFRAILSTQFLQIKKINEIENSVQIKIGKSDKLDALKKLLKKQLFSVKESEADGEKLLVASKYKWSHLGHLLTHISLIVIVLGSLIYTRTDRQEFRYVIAEEHKESEIFEQFPDLFNWHFMVTDEDHPTLIVDSFRVRYYNDNHGPSISDFRSYVRLFDHSGNMLAKHEVTVNSPLIYKHVSIHQSDYKPLVDEFFRNIPNRQQIVGQAQNNQERAKNETNWITGLSLRANKGKSVIFAGMLLSSIGLTMAFMFWPRRIWASIKKDTIAIAGISRKNKIAFQSEFDKIIKRLENE